MSQTEAPTRSAIIEDAHHHLSSLIVSSPDGIVIVPAAALQIAHLTRAEASGIAVRTSEKFVRNTQHYDFSVSYDERIGCFIAVPNKTVRDARVLYDLL